MKIFITHPELNGQETRLSSDVAAGAATSTVENNKGFATNDYVVFGKPGDELTEIVLLTSTASIITLGHTNGPSFAHSARTPVSQINYNQVKIYSATSEDGTYSLLTTVDLTLDQDFTVYDDSTGTSSTWYKIKYYNATTDALSSYSVAVRGTGYTEDSLYSMTEEILEEFGDETETDISKDLIHKHLRAGVRKITTELFKQYPDALRTYTTITPNGTGLDPLPDYFLGLIRVDINATGTVATDAYKAEYISESWGDPDTNYYSTDPMVAIRGTNLVTRPVLSSSGKIFMWYWSYPVPMTEENDEHGLPYGAREVLVDYALYRIWTSKENETGAGTRAYSYKQKYKDDLDDYIDFVAQARQTINNKKVDLVIGTDLYEEII
jgi:hypothetical protein